jgi:hypothetical protein
MVGTDGHRADTALRQWIIPPGQGSKLVLQLQAPRRKAEYTLAVGVQQEQGGIGRRGEYHLCEVRSREQVGIPVGRQGIHQRRRVHATRRDSFDPAVGAGGEMSIGVQDVKIVVVNREIDGIRQLRDLSTKKEIGTIEENANLAYVDPHRTGLGIEDVEIPVVQREGFNPSPVGIRGWKRDGLCNLAGRAV